MDTSSNSVVDQREILRYIQHGKLYYNEPKLRTENHPFVNQGIVKFREWRAAFEESHVKPDATDVPQKFIDLIAILLHDSDESLEKLCHRINDLLSPFDRNETVSVYFYYAIEQIIKAVGYQERYGLADIVTLLNNGTTTSIPSRFSIYRWQAHDMTNFPFEIKDLALKRRERRKVMSRNFTDAFQLLDKSERMLLLEEKKESSALSASSTTENNSNNNNNNKKQYQQNGKEELLLFPMYTKEDYLPIPQKSHKKTLPTTAAAATITPTPTTANQRYTKQQQQQQLQSNNPAFLKKQFLKDLSPIAKQKRGVTINVDLKKLLLSKKTSSYYSMYRKIKSLRMKLIQFHENVRPAYFGTWTKQSQFITGRTPFAKDTFLLDYDYDSEAEWDWDVDGDDIHSLEDNEDLAFPDSNDDEEEEEEKNSGEKWLVPEGYLSEDEGLNEKQSRRIVSRPVKLPALKNKHFPMEHSIQGPYFQLNDDVDNEKEHPLLVFKYQMLVDIPPEGYSPFDMTLTSQETDDSEEVEENATTIEDNKEQLCDIILRNRYNSVNGIVEALKKHTSLKDASGDEIQHVLFSIAVQESRDSQGFRWFIRE